MTAEIAIMNKTAVALAADSAVTIGGKIYNTANKLFALSKYHPIGIMIYGNAELTGVPWETLIKIFRDNLEKQSFSSTKEYGDAFIEFLYEHITDYFSEDNQQRRVVYFFAQQFDVLRKKIDFDVNEMIQKEKDIGDDEIRDIVNCHVESHIEETKPLRPRNLSL